MFFAFLVTATSCIPNIADPTDHCHASGVRNQQRYLSRDRHVLGLFFQGTTSQWLSSVQRTFEQRLSLSCAAHIKPARQKRTKCSQYMPRIRPMAKMRRVRTWLVGWWRMSAVVMPPPAMQWHSHSQWRNTRHSTHTHTRVRIYSAYTLSAHVNRRIFTITSSLSQLYIYIYM